MYLTLNFHHDNIYILHNNHKSKLIKNNYLYSLTNKYTKIISVLNNNQIDTIKITEDSKLPININTNWSLSKDSNIKKILLPPANKINLIDTNIDLNNINCICQDQTSIRKLPKINIINNNNIFTLSKWTGNNQTWVSHTSYKEYVIYGFLYIFLDKAIFMSSIYKNTSDINEFNDLDIMSIYQYDDISQDEFNRINCVDLKMQFDTCDILHRPLTEIIENLKIETIYE